MKCYIDFRRLFTEFLLKSQLNKTIQLRRSCATLQTFRIQRNECVYIYYIYTISLVISSKTYRNLIRMSRKQNNLGYFILARILLYLLEETN